MVNIILNVVVLVMSIVFTTYMTKIWFLLRHNGLFLMLFAGLAGVGIRVLALLESLSILTRVQILHYSIPLGIVLWSLLSIGMAVLYYEVRKLLSRKLNK